MKTISILAATTLCAVLFNSCQGPKAEEVPIYNPNITEVFDFTPAPGQFVNKMPLLTANMSKSEVAAVAAKALVGRAPGDLITLGGFGGSITFGFDHMIENKTGLRDFRILGNAFSNSPDPAISGGSSEPGIIYVSFDSNNNGKPDDTWYVIAGSEYKNSASMPDYQITYHRPSSENAATNYIKWADNKNMTGYMAKLQYNLQSYYPLPVSDASISFTGLCLPKNAVDAYGDGSLWILKAYGRGYADNAPNNHPDSAIDISWAVNADGTPANLKGINFVKVVTGVNQQCGQIGETSTEICGAYDLHLMKETVVSQ